jgi:hypothetical protein
VEWFPNGKRFLCVTLYGTVYIYTLQGHLHARVNRIYLDHVDCTIHPVDDESFLVVVFERQTFKSTTTLYGCEYFCEYGIKWQASNGPVGRRCSRVFEQRYMLDQYGESIGLWDLKQLALVKQYHVAQEGTRDFVLAGPDLMYLVVLDMYSVRLYSRDTGECLEQFSKYTSSRESVHLHLSNPCVLLTGAVMRGSHEEVCAVWQIKKHKQSGSMSKIRHALRGNRYGVLCQL